MACISGVFCVNTIIQNVYFGVDTNFLRTLDSSIKRNTAVIKKLKQINEEQKEGLLEELKAVNLSKFVSEAVAAICEAKLKTSDINAAVQVVLAFMFLITFIIMLCLCVLGLI